MFTRYLARLLLPLMLSTWLPLAGLAQQPVMAPKPSIIYKVQAPNERLEMTVRTSRIISMDQKIPQAQVNNPDILELTPLSPNQVQVAAKATGVTQINLWGEDQKLFTIDVIVYGDARELEMLLKATFPTSSLKVVPVSNSVMISGFVDQQPQVERIIRIAEEYYPKVINNMTVCGVQQVLLHVKIMEVSRTNLRRLGVDWGQMSGQNIFASTPNHLLADFDPTKVTAPPNLLRLTTPSTFAFSVVSGNDAFFGVLDAMRQNNLAKIMAEPTLTTTSGCPASFLAGGSFYVIPQGLAAAQPIEVSYGTKLDFVPIVLGNGRIHLDVRPNVSQIDPSLNVQGYPALLKREAQTGVELQAGQTLAIAGLVQSRVEAENRGLPWVSDLPYIGAAFRKVEEKTNEVELLILVTPELAEAMDACEVPPYGPGMQTTVPNDWQLFMKGHLEVPSSCPTAVNDPNGPPPAGMPLGPGEKIPTPLPADRPEGSARHHRYNSSMPTSPTPASPKGSKNDPPGFIGPVGYDVVK